MDLTASQVAAATFRTVRKGYDPEEVDSFLQRVAKALEQSQQHATAMEARARAAVSRLQEYQATSEAGIDAAPEPSTEAQPEELHVAPDEAETISRTLLLAQRTADTTIAEARSEADRIRAEAKSEAESTIDSTREMSAKLLQDAREDARRASAAEREAAENEVESLKARREFLLGDVDQLEQFLVDQRERLRGAARQIEAMCERVPAGLGAVRPPALSASDDEPVDETQELVMPPEASGPFATVDELANALDAAGGQVIESVDPSSGDIDAADPDAPALPTRDSFAASDDGAVTWGDGAGSDDGDGDDGNDGNDGNDDDEITGEHPIVGGDAAWRPDGSQGD
jgi:DivIVA domain-containing protein